MKILAIRGCNLASLAGEFEIDLAHGALASAGVFAIVGPTGAGKSTLLDAMCVALFDRTPRLTNRSMVVIGRGDDDPAALGAQDVRTILRRGASTGWAEVDFESGDARRYRARWSVRRARGASDGRFQNQQVTLTAIDSGQQLGGTKTETLEAIHQRLGLSFDQFRRSALLAQGEFAAFLRADGKDRSELLERMTGTEIYSKLSIAAHARAVLVEQQLRDRQSAVVAIGVLSNEARSHAEGALALAKAAQQTSRARLAEAEAIARWLAEAERRQRALAEAEAARISADQAVASAQGERDELALRRRAETLRSRWDEASRLDRQLALANAEVIVGDETVEHARAHQATLAARRARLGELQAPVRAARIAAGLVERGGVGGSGLGVDTQALEARASAAAEAAAWLIARRELAGAVRGWRELDGRLGAHAALATEIAHADRTLDEHAQRRKVLVAQHTSTTAAHRQAIARLGEAQRDAAAFQQRRGLSLDTARRQEDEARQRCGELERLAALAAAARAAATARAELQRQLAELAAAATDDERRRHTTEAERNAAALLRADRAHVLDELRRAAGYEHARAELVEGDPCPLCGAIEHPWRGRGSFDDLIAQAQARLVEAAARSDAAIGALAAIDARVHHRVLERTRVEACLATASATESDTRDAWRAHLAALGELVLVEDPASTDAERLARERIAAGRTKLEAARTARSQAEAVAKAGVEAQARVQARQTDVEHHGQKLRELDAALATLDAAAERVRGERAGKLERERELATAIDSALASWRHGGVAGSGDAQLEPAQLRAITGDDPVRRRRVLAELARTWMARAEHIADLDAALGDALAGSDVVARDAERTLTEQVARRTASAQRRDELVAELADARSRLDAARDAAGFDRDALRRLLEADPASVDDLAEHLDRLERAADRARTLVAERRRLVEDHAASRPPPQLVGNAASRPPPQLVGNAASSRDSTLPDGAPPAIRRRDGSSDDITLSRDRSLSITPEVLAELAAAVAAADHDAAALAAALAADDDARVRRAAVATELVAAEQTAEIDRVLAEMIGSHDGKLFRSFAQSLTLDSLLEVANSHLEELAPRYALERVPKHDLELQVIDRDLGNEVRSVQSLSGGESFLVSLALALGLSSMSAHDVRVRTLLIDEGFGTLDPATLDSALAVLDALQATGRQVGIISHVPALVERVGAHVRVAPKGGGRSEVIVSEA